MQCVAARMRGHTQALVKDLHCRGCGAQFYLLPRELVRHAVPVVVELGVIVDVDVCSFPIA